MNYLDFIYGLTLDFFVFMLCYRFLQGLNLWAKELSKDKNKVTVRLPSNRNLKLFRRRLKNG